MNSLQIEELDHDSQSGVGSMCCKDKVMSKSNYLQLFDDFTLARFAFNYWKGQGQIFKAIRFFLT